MTTRAIERVDDWETRSFDGGYRGLHGLADDEFSGVVRSPAGTLCMLNGAVVGILDGSIEDFEDADGTAYVAPTPALPLLIVMQDRGDEVRAKYYTEDTPLSKVDSTLSDGGFTGYIELSENVLSGDYYVVYHGGRSMSIAFVGNSGQLLSEDEAFERANDEVGIYKVRAVDIDPVEIPELTSPAPSDTDEGSDSTATAVGTAESDRDATAAEPAEDQAAEGSATTDEPVETSEPAPGTAGGAEEVTADAESEPPAESETATGATDIEDSSPSDDDEAERGSERSASATSGGAGGQEATVKERETETAGGEQAATAGTTTGEETEVAEETADTEQRTAAETAPRDDGATRERARSDETSGKTASESARSSSTDRRPESSSAATAATHGAETGSAADLETRTIPSLDPDRTWNETRDAASSGGTVTTGHSTRSQKPEPSDEPRPRSADSGGSPERSRDSTPSGSSTTGSEAGTGEQTRARDGQTQSGGTSRSGTDERAEELQNTIAEREERIDELETRLEDARQARDEATTERDELAAERDALAAERDDLRAERDELQTELERAREELASLREQRDSLQSKLEGIDTEGAAAERRLSRQEAMDGTDLFVRYNSKGEPTLKTAHDSGASRSDVNANLNVEYHTQFETDGVVVAGQPFDTFLRNTIEFRFASWLVRQLLFEIRDTGHRSALSDLYDTLPLIDRAELNGEASVEYTEEGQTKRSQQSFDVVFRDRMGNPLIVANFNDSRQAATEDDMRSLVTAATRVGESVDTLAGAIYVTASFFEPDALEMADDATGGGLLSRDKRESYVKVSRKQGYHLCLVEARDEQFHMAVPEL